MSFPFVNFTLLLHLRCPDLTVLRVSHQFCVHHRGRPDCVWRLYCTKQVSALSSIVSRACIEATRFSFNLLLHFTNSYLTRFNKIAT